jgi:hypothetical protein
MSFSTSTPCGDILAWLHTQQTTLFPETAPPIHSFTWIVPTAKREQHWAGSYQHLAITLNPEFFSGLSDPHTAICDVLLHELCHHIQRYKFGDSIPPHGREFRELAAYVNGRLRRDAVTHYHSLARTLEGQAAERAQRKALALLARTTSANEHEAALAAAKYAEFTEKNNIVLDAHSAALADGLPVMVKEHVWTAKQRSAWLSTLVHTVAHTHACTYTYVRCYDACTKFYFYGRPVKISQAYDLLDYLVEAVGRVVAKAQQEAKKNPPVPEPFDPFASLFDPNYRPRNSPRGRSYWIAFREGVARRIAQSLMADHKRRLAEGVVASNGINHIPGLVLRTAFDKERSAADECLYDYYPGLRGKKGSSPSGARSRAGREAGYTAGAAVSVARQVDTSSTRSIAAAQ